MSRIHEISAVHDKDLEELLRSLNLLEEVRKGHIKCGLCGATITLENLQCIYPKEGEIAFCCHNISCFERAIRDSKGEERDGL